MSSREREGKPAPHARGLEPPDTRPAKTARRPQQSVEKALRELRFLAFSVARPAVMVVSHERSGTHFLMNAIGRGYGYAVKPWIDLDHNHLPINYYRPANLATVLGHLSRNHVASVVKSHHAVDFFDGVLDEILENTTIFYIHRNPVSVMPSFRRFVRHWHWREGPSCDDALSFARAEPEGRLLRYQMRQRRNMLVRWAAHVEGWVGAAETRARLRVVRYDRLKDDYAATLTDLADLFDIPPRDLTPPPPDVNVIARSTGDETADERAALQALALAEVGDTMRALGYA